jgi:glutathione peroxidase-family protein
VSSGKLNPATIFEDLEEIKWNFVKSVVDPLGWVM